MMVMVVMMEESFRLPKFSTQLFSGICSYTGKYFTKSNTGSRDSCTADLQISNMIKEWT